MRIRVKGFQIFRDRHGKTRCYHRVTRHPIDLEICPLGSAEFFAECTRIAAFTIPEADPRPGTLGRLIIEYQSHPDFTRLASRTKRDYDRCFDYLKGIDDAPLLRFNRPFVVRIRDEAFKHHKRRFANYVKSVLSILFNWAMERGYVDINPAEGVKNVKRPKDAPRANRPWSDQECFTVIDAAPYHIKVPLALGMYCGMREGDALRLSKTAYDGTWIEFRTGKTGRLVEMQAPAALKQVLDHAPRTGATTIAANSRGIPWTESGFRASWRKLRIEIERGGKIGYGLTFHGLRHTVGTRLAEEDCDDGTIAAVLGQKTRTMAAHYSRDADKRRQISSAVAKLDASENRRRTNIVKPTLKTVKPKEMK